MPTSEQLVPQEDLPDSLLVPEDDLPDDLKPTAAAHATPAPAGPKPKRPGFWSEAKGAIKGAVQGTAHLAKQVATGDFAGASRDLLQPHLDALNRAGESFGEGKYLDAARHGVAAAVPMIGPMSERAGDLADEGNLRGAAGAVAGNAALLALPAVGEGLKAAKAPLGRALARGAESEYTKALKPSLSAKPKDVKRAVAHGLEKGRRISDTGLENTKALIAEIEAKKDAIVDTAPGKPISPGRVAKYTRELSKKPAYQNTPDARSIRRTTQDFYQFDRPGGVIAKPGKAARNLTAREAQDIKKGIYSRIGNRAYGEAKTAVVETEKQIARALNDDVANAFPEMRGINKEQGGAIELAKFIEHRVRVEANKASSGAGSALGAGVGAAVEGMVGAAKGYGAAHVASIVNKVIRNPGVRSRIAIAMHKASGKLLTPTKARATVAQRLQALQESIENGDISFGLAIRHVNTGVDLPTNRAHFGNAAGTILLDLKPKNLSEFRQAVYDQMGPEALRIELRNGKQTKLSLHEAYAEAKKGAARILRESTKTIKVKQKDGSYVELTGKGFTSYDDYKQLADSPEGRATLGWYRSVGDLVKKHKWSPEDVDTLLRWENAYSANRGVSEAMALALDAIKKERAGLIDEIRDTIPQQAKQLTLEGGTQRGPKLGPYYDAKKAEIGGPQPDWTVADGRMHEASGFLAEAPTQTSRQAIDMRNRIETKRLGLSKIQEGQEMTWGGHQAKNKGNPEANVSFADRAIAELEAQGGYDAVFRPAKAEDFAFGANLPTRVTISKHAIAEAARDMERNEGFTLHPKGGGPPRGGYIYSVDKNFERVHPRAISSRDIENYMKAHGDALSGENRYLGGWKDGVNRYLDVSAHEMDLSKALEAAKAADQKAIWDNTNFKSIPMEGTASVVVLNDGRTFISDFVPTSNPQGLMTHVQLLKKNGITLDDVKAGLDIENTGWIIDGELQTGGGGTVGKGVQVGAPENPNYVPYKDRKKAEE